MTAALQEGLGFFTSFAGGELLWLLLAAAASLFFFFSFLSSASVWFAAVVYLGQRSLIIYKVFKPI